MKDVNQIMKKCARLHTIPILEDIDTVRVRLFKLGYQALDQKRFSYVHNMFDVINQSEEDSEKVLLKVRQGKPVCPHDYESP
jgi:hypothetical protein